jgi:hypothetical protein
MHDLLKIYQRRLTNLTANNRSLLLLRLFSDHFIDIHEFDFMNNQPSFQIIEKLVSRKGNIPLVRQIDSRDESVNKISRRLNKLRRTDQFIYEERGARDLYVGWPFVRGRFLDGTNIRCPLVFFPVEVELRDQEWILSQRKEVNITFNKSFLLAYAHFNQVVLEDELLEWVFDESNKDSRVFRTSLYQLFKESPVELNFNQEKYPAQLPEKA